MVTAGGTVPVIAAGALAEHVGSRQVSQDIDAVLMAAGDYVFQVLPVLLLVLEIRGRSPSPRSPRSRLKLRLLQQAEQLLQKFGSMGADRHILFFGAELVAPTRFTRPSSSRFVARPLE